MSCFKNVVTKKLLEIEIMFVEKVGVVNDFCLDFFVLTLCVSSIVVCSNCCDTEMSI